MEEETFETLSKEEILERSRKENKMTGDEREQSRRLWSKFAGFAAMVIACGVVMIVNSCLYDDLSYEIFAILYTGLGTQGVVEAIVTQNKAARIFSAVAAIFIWSAAIVYWVQWGMQLAGI